MKMLQKINTIDTEKLMQYTNTNKRGTKEVICRELLKGGALSIGTLIEEGAAPPYPKLLSGEFR